MKESGLIGFDATPPHYPAYYANTRGVAARRSTQNLDPEMFGRYLLDAPPEAPS